jgi:iron(III) transport system permease protein
MTVSVRDASAHRGLLDNHVQAIRQGESAASRLRGWLAPRLLWFVLLVFVFVVSIIPLIYVVNSAFYKETDMGLSAQRSFEALIDVYTTREYLKLLFNALSLATVVALLSMVIGVLMALIIGRTDIRGKPTWDLLITMPLFLSPFTGLISWVALGSEKTGFINVALRPFFSLFVKDPQPLINIWTYAGMVWVMFLFFCPFAYMFTVGSLRGMDTSMEEAARTVGASYPQTLLKITLPMSSPAIFAAALLILILGAEMYTIPGIIGTTAGFDTLPWRMYHDMTIFPVKHAHAAAAGTILMICTAAGIYMQHRMTRKSERFITITGKGFRGTPVRLGRWKWAAIAVLAFYVGSAVILPFGSLLMMSLMKFSAPMITRDIFTLEHYDALFTNPALREALFHTIEVSFAAGVACVLVGFLISYSEVRRPSASARFLAFLAILPVAVPGVVYGAGLLWTYLRTPLYGSLTILLLAYIAKFLPYGVIISRSGILQIHPELEQSARMSGAGQTRALTAITLPLLKSSLVALFFFVMLMSIKELAASVLLYTERSQVLSVLTWHYMDNGNYQFAAAAAVVQTVIIIGIIVITRLIFRVSLNRTMGQA